MDKIIEQFVLNMIREKDMEYRVRMYVSGMRSGDYTIDDVVACEDNMFSFVGCIRDMKDLSRHMIQYGYTVNEVRELNGEEPVSYGWVSMSKPPEPKTEVKEVSAHIDGNFEVKEPITVYVSHECDIDVVSKTIIEKIEKHVYGS